MAYSQNIFGPQGMSGYTSGAIGISGPQGMTGATGVQGTVGISGMTGLSGDDIYNMVMSRYRMQGFDMKWDNKDGTYIKIKDMDDGEIRNSLKIMRSTNITDTKRAWIDIFADVIVKRRKFKLDKL